MLMSVHLIAHGKVQGVCYRVGTHEKALQLGLCGWAKIARMVLLKSTLKEKKKSLSSLSTGAEKARRRLRSLLWVLSRSNLKACQF
jgi:acylphosphatase